MDINHIFMKLLKIPEVYEDLSLFTGYYQRYLLIRGPLNVQVNSHVQLCVPVLFVEAIFLHFTSTLLVNLGFVPLQGLCSIWFYLIHSLCGSWRFPIIQFDKCYPCDIYLCCSPCLLLLSNLEGRVIYNCIALIILLCKEI